MEDFIFRDKVDENWKAFIATIQVNYNQVTPNTIGAKTS